MGGPTDIAARRGLAIAMLGGAAALSAALLLGTSTATLPASLRGPLPLWGILLSVLPYLMVMASRQRVGRSRLLARPGRLVAPVRALRLAAQPSLLMIFLASLVAETYPDWRDDHGALLAADVAMVVALVAVCVAATVPTVLMLGGTGAVEVRPDAVAIRVPLARYHIPWSALAHATSGRPPLPLGLARPVLEVPLARPDEVVRRGLARRGNPIVVNLGDVDVHPWYLSDVMAYYLEHPDKRTEIGANPLADVGSPDDDGAV